MNLYFMRHGIAVAAHDPSIGHDNERPLTNKGIKRMRRVARGLCRLDISFDAILSSPVLRARQTADIVATALDMEALVEETSWLAPESTVEHLLFGLTRYQDREHCLLIGHQPLLSQTISALLCSGAPELAIQIRKGSICRVEIAALPPSAAGMLHWLITPKQLRHLGD